MLNVWGIDLRMKMVNVFYPVGVAPNSIPIPAVIAIDNAPQKVTRLTAVNTEAPPVLAERPPSSMSDSNEPPPTTVIRGMKSAVVID